LLLWTSILHCHLPGVATVARRLRYSYSWLRLILFYDTNDADEILMSAPSRPQTSVVG